MHKVNGTILSNNYMGVPKVVVPPKHPKMIILVGKPIVVGYHHFRNPPYSCWVYDAALSRMIYGAVDEPVSQWKSYGCSCLHGVSFMLLGFHHGTASWLKVHI